ncbi:sulfotransferase domain-containing protein [Gloeothece citriformis]|nr:sulfotransferase domain-containing protein [Gloeothece citriformis]
MAQEKFDKYSDYGFLRKIGLKEFVIIIFIQLKYGNIVIKTHSEPTFLIKLLIALGLAKATFCYRDPRDTILSAIDHGERSRKGLDPGNGFKNMKTVKDGLPLVKFWTSNWYKWHKIPQVFLIKYENLMINKFAVLLEMSQFLNLNLKEEEIKQIYLKHENNKATAWNFNKGTIERYKTDMNESDLILCNQELQDTLKAMGYIN